MQNSHFYNLITKTIKYLRWYPFKKLIYLYQTKIRRCKCCNKLSIIVSLDKGEETKRCIRCLANLRYEMIAEYIHANYEKSIKDISVLELDFNSPLKNFLYNSKEYVMTYYSGKDKLGDIKDGVRCEDITRLTFENNKFDLIISSDVLEHVCDLGKAFSESARVLKSGGIHIFTVPVGDGTTFKRCDWVNNELKHFAEPEYHYDPLDKNGCLVYWTFGTDIGDYFVDKNYKISVVKGPIGQDKRYLIILKKTVDK